MHLLYKALCYHLGVKRVYINANVIAHDRILHRVFVPKFLKLFSMQSSVYNHCGTSFWLNG